MVDPGVLPGFVLVILLFLAPPGPDMAYMVAVGLQSGRRAATQAILGIGTGMSLYATAVVAGVGRLAQSHPDLLDTVKLLGAAYLFRLAWVTVHHARHATQDHTEAPTGHPFLRGAVVSLANPKVMLFFVSVLPQFIGSAQDPSAQLAMLGAVNVGTEVLLYGSIGVTAGVLHGRFGNSQGSRTALTYVAGSVYAVLAVVVAADVLVGS